MKRALLLLAGCSGGAHAVDAGSDAAPVTCAAAFTGNFAESSFDPANCPTLAAGVLAFSIPVATLGNPLAVQIALGSATPGAYSSDATTWSARAVQMVGNGICLYSAGSNVVPHGYFDLVLDAVDPPHGTLSLTQYVLVYPETDCGTEDTEQVHVTF